MKPEAIFARVNDYYALGHAEICGIFVLDQCHRATASICQEHGVLNTVPLLCVTCNRVRDVSL